MNFANTFVHCLFIRKRDLRHIQIHHFPTLLTYKVIMWGHCGVEMICTISTTQFLNFAACRQQIQIAVNSTKAKFRIFLFEIGINCLCRRMLRR